MALAFAVSFSGFERDELGFCRPVAITQLTKD